ncbi:MAG: DUF2721 domain-containing protein [Acidobacteriota bacterium]
MAGLGDNPFAALTIVVAPAVLTNASSVLCLGTGNRIARVVDRTRVLNAELATLPLDDARRESLLKQLARLRVRGHLLLGALRFLYTSIGSFAAAALISIIGALIATRAGDGTFHAFALLGLAVGTVGVMGLVVGCTMMVRETGLAVDFLSEELDLAGEHPTPGAPI